MYAKKSFSTKHLCLLIFTASFFTVCLAESSHSSDISMTYLTGRHTFLRGETAEILLKIDNNTDQPITDANLHINISDLIKNQNTLTSIPAKTSHEHLFKVNTNKLKKGRYNLNCRLISGNQTLAEKHIDIAVAAPWNPERMRVWLWPHHKFGENVWKMDEEAQTQLQWYADKGFNSFNPGGGVREAQNNFGGFPDEKLRLYDHCLYNGWEAGFAAYTGFFFEDEIEDKDAKFEPQNPWKPFEKFTNPFHPDVASLQEQKNRQLMERLRKFPGLGTCYLESEMEQCLLKDTPLAKTQYPNAMPEATEHTFILPGVIADTDRGYLEHMYRYKWGDGLVIANSRAARIVHEYRPDILIFGDPLRYTTAYGRFYGADSLSTWIYMNPDPRFILYIETLIASGKLYNQSAIQTITLLNYPGTLAPKDKGWTLMGPDRLVETSWLTLSRNPEALSYYVSSGCDPFRPGYTKNVISPDKATPLETRVYPYCQYPESFQALKTFMDEIVKPYGPMIRNLDRTKRNVAVLSSESSSVYRDSPKLIGHYPPFQIYNFYSVLDVAHISADIVLDETIRMFGLDGYDVLFMPKCDTITESVYKKIVEFQQRGGTVISDQYLRAPLKDVTKFDFDFTHRSKVSANAIIDQKDFAELSDNIAKRSAQLKKVKGVTAMDDWNIMESYASQLRKQLPDIPRVADCPQPSVSLNMLEKDDARYLFVVNDKRTYGERFGQYKAMLEKTVPQTVPITLPQSTGQTLYLYDMIDKKILPYDTTENAIIFDVDLPAPGGKIIAIFEQKLGKLQIEAPKTITVQDNKQRIDILVKDNNSRLMRAIIPISVQITDPKGNPSEFSDYYAAKSGRLTIDFIPALNDIKGTWKITATELLTGKTTRKTFKLK